MTQALKQNLILIAGRYEGIDERLIELDVDEEWSIGDYVLSGGELPAMVLIDALIRQRPGVLGHEDSADQDSFAAGLLDCPHYTRPDSYEGKKVPTILLSGDHEKIRRWRLQQSLQRTQQRRPDLIDRLELNKEQRALLKEMSNALADDGKGYPHDFLGRIGDPFLRRQKKKKNPDRPEYEGMGLGLFIAKTMLERTNAKLTFANGTVTAAPSPALESATGAMVSVIWDRDNFRESDKIDPKNIHVKL